MRQIEESRDGNNVWKKMPCRIVLVHVGKTGKDGENVDELSEDLQMQLF